MNLRFLETFVWVARLRKMTVVAQRLHGTDATISARIAALEDELGVKVFVQEKGQQLSLTAIGAEMLQPAGQSADGEAAKPEQERGQPYGGY